MSTRGDTEHVSSPSTSHEGRLDAEFGGAEARHRLERGLLRKIDARMSILVVIYILNYVRFFLCLLREHHPPKYVLIQIDRNNVAAARLRGFETGESTFLFSFNFLTL